MSDLADFLLARFAEDEAYARNAFGDHNDATPEWTELWSGAVDLGGGEDLVITNDSQVSRHIVRWDPVRVLAECDAKRQIVQTYERLWQRAEELRQVGRDVDAATARAIYSGVEMVIGYLAAPYDGHPDYRSEWSA